MRLKLDSSPVCLWRRVLGKDASDAKGTKRQVSPGKPLTQNSEVRRQLLYEREPSRRECPEAFNSISRNAMINQMYVQFMKPPTTNARKRMADRLHARRRLELRATNLIDHARKSIAICACRELKRRFLGGSSSRFAKRLQTHAR